MSSSNPDDSNPPPISWKPNPKTKTRRDVRQPKVRKGRESPARKGTR